MAGRGLNSQGRRWHRHLDNVSGALLLFLVVFAPWGAGGTLFWSSWVLIVTGWVLGLLCVAKWGVLQWTGFQPAVWRREGTEVRWPIWGLGALTGLVLAQVGVSLWNARAEVNWGTDGLELLYRDAVSWLPTTYDLAATRKALFRYLAFAGAFWAMRDWLRIKSRGERHREEDGRAVEDAGRVPDRVRWLGWTLSVNAALMAMVGIVHRLDGSPDLLWLTKSAMMKVPGMMFGSYPYRANAAQFLNLVWPLALGLWWMLRHEHLQREPLRARAGGQAYPILLLLVAIMIGGILVAGSRAGIAIALVQMVLSMFILARAMGGWRPRVAMALAFVAALALGWGLAGKFLQTRFSNALVDDSMSGRTEIYAVAHRMASDFPVWGSGAESFLALNGLYRSKMSGTWYGYVHDDWLETQLTLGWIGLGVVVGLLFLAVLARWRCGCIPVVRESQWLLWVGLGGILAHARVDFPFQIPSVHLLFVLLAALFTVIGPSTVGTLKGSSPGKQ
jgi:hypothetical protein